MTKPTLTVYGRFQYLFPPRPAVKVPQSAIAWYARRGYIAQKKKNGTCTLVFCHGKDVIFKTRHPDENDGNHLQWSPLPEHLEFFGSLGKGWNVFVAELIHSKVAGGPKNELYIFDQLVADGRELQGLTQAQRQDLMAKRWGIDYSEADEEDGWPRTYRWLGPSPPTPRCSSICSPRWPPRTRGWCSSGPMPGWSRASRPPATRAGR